MGGDVGGFYQAHMPHTKTQERETRNAPADQNRKGDWIQPSLSSYAQSAARRRREDPEDRESARRQLAVFDLQYAAILLFCFKQDPNGKSFWQLAKLDIDKQLGVLLHTPIGAAASVSVQ
jgi:hypothetical protein